MKHSKSALVLMELIIVILFFSLASTVCIRLFSKAHLLSKQTVNENHAVIQAQNLAECFLATEGDMTQIKKLFASAVPDTSDDTILLLFNKDWQECDRENAVYCAELISRPETNGLISAEITVAPYAAESTEPIYSLTVMHHIPERRGSHE